MFSAYAPGGTSLANEKDYKSASLATTMVGVGGIGGLDPVDLSTMLPGNCAGVAVGVRLLAGRQRLRDSEDLETALQLDYLAHTAPNLTPDVAQAARGAASGPSLQNHNYRIRA